ncbi:anhydro-N-acetylmuramic acid kinase [Aestuariirhabdus sp. Z084]|uniref:anhydro-N-acetylmuramic acid kinase n=1 Tax=Aestuariirhabdus haliotis TaxID=2918751 RepID=UPI00201B45C2|nr:anhydro-N-acetylmuramic acid kinase [Aestuariirhabdus haliotis]MCL6415323.1 anhydro-N-acetylmuramic acid kinase [Aestuariirhabdus haliotis]MCL6419079.1 anhydro-N-acetylmuramic acid kinase [Aestuariirhabdus haliotis]
MAIRRLTIGLMSGTSLDGVDGVLADFSSDTPLIGTSSRNFPTDLRRKLLSLCLTGDNEIERIAQIQPQLTQLYADVVKDLLTATGRSSAQIAAIGCHGQTVRHLPHLGYSLQLGNPAQLAELCKIAVVADFRSRDLAAGGEGAPLVPAFHSHQFSSPDQDRIVINIGGMANISCLPIKGDVTGFDTGPGNALMDAWCERHQGKPYDENGSWAASGSVNTELLKSLLADDYFQRPPPKSTGREHFNLPWLEPHLARHAGMADEDVQATLLELTAQSLRDAIDRWGPAGADCYICGGGAYNTQLIRRLQALMPTRSVTTTNALGIDPQWVEAITFAWLTRQYLEGLPGNLPQVTRARGPRILGAFYPA